MRTVAGAIIVLAAAVLWGAAVIADVTKGYTDIGRNTMVLAGIVTAVGVVVMVNGFLSDRQGSRSSAP